MIDHDAAEQLVAIPDFIRSILSVFGAADPGGKYFKCALDVRLPNRFGAIMIQDLAVGPMRAILAIAGWAIVVPLERRAEFRVGVVDNDRFRHRNGEAAAKGLVVLGRGEVVV